MVNKIRLSKRQREALETSRLAEDQWQRYVRARDNGHLDYLETADRCNNFYVGNGNQWDPQDRRKLEAEGRPALEINLILSTVNAVLGEQSAKRSEFKYKPRMGGTEAVATVLTKLIAEIKDNNGYDWVESNVFSDGIIQHGRGFFDIRMGFDDHMQGDIHIVSKDPKTIVLSPDAKEYDPNTWQEVFESRWMTIAEIEATYGEKKADEVRTLGINADRYSNDSLVWEEDTFGDPNKEELNQFGMALSDAEEKTIRRARVIERQHVRLVPVRKFVDPINGDMKKVPETWSDRKVSDFGAQHGLLVISVVDRRIRWTTTVDKVVLHDDWSPYSTFTYIPFFAYFRRGKPFGLVTNLLSPQEQLNKLASQELHILNTTANSGWIIEQNSLVGMTADDLREHGAETGLVLEVRKGAQLPDKIGSNKIPTGIERAAFNSAQFIKEISGVNDSILGFDSPEVSGVALEQKQFRGQVQMQVPFDNLRYTRRLVANKLLELVQQFYDEQRVFTITTSGINTEDPEDQQIIINHQVGASEVINNVTVGRYDVVLSSTPARDSYDDAQFAEALNLRSIGIALPDDRIIEHSHLDNKAELAEEVRRMQGRGKLTPEEQEVQRIQQEANLRLLMAEVDKGETEVIKLQAEIQKLLAEAELKDGGMMSPEVQVRLEDLEARVQMNRENNDLRRELARLSAMKTLDNSALNIKGKVIDGVRREQERRQTELLTNLQTERMRQMAKDRGNPNA